MDGAPEDSVFRNFQEMTVTDEDVNILLLGETGVGKSTFINAFANYLEYDKFNIAEKSKVRCLIPARFTVTNENFEEKLVHIGRDANENDTMAESGTLQTRSYVFPISKQGINRIRLIDTPGIGDTRGIEQDNENMENILAYISHLENLHAICFLLKPNNARLTVMFHYCMKQLLSRLEKSASKNIIFLFTNTRSTFYKPGDTTPALKKILEDIRNKPPNTDIKFTKDNVFCLDNESFRYMVAVKSGVQLGNKESFAQSWDHSVKECWRMIDFITGKGNTIIKITPHKVKNTLSVNEARRVILQLSQPLADIAELINDNITTLEKHKKSLNTDNLSIAELQKNLYVPVINLRHKELSKPVTVCAATKCCEIYTVQHLKKYHYKQRCHNPCYLTTVPRELIGASELVHCSAMTNRRCRVCDCDVSTHMHIYYESETYDDKIDNEGVKAQIKDRETAKIATQNMIARIQGRKLDFEKEKDTIIKTMAIFAHFLQRNAIAPYNDSNKAYIEYLIDREKSQGDNCDVQVVRHYNDLLQRYEEEKKVLEQALNSNSSGIECAVTAESVFDSVKVLYQLQHTGQKIKELHTRHTKNQTKEHKNTEIVLEDANQHVKHSKQENKSKYNQRNKKQNHNEYGKGGTGINTHNTPHMKAKDRRPDHNQKRYQNRMQQNIPDTDINVQGNFRNKHNPQNYRGHRPPFLQNQGFSGSHGNLLNYSGQPINYPQEPHASYFGGPPVNSQNQPPFQNYQGQPNPNYQRQQNPNFANYQGQQNPNYQGQQNPNFQRQQNPNYQRQQNPNYQGHQNSNFPNYTPPQDFGNFQNQQGFDPNSHNYQRNSTNYSSKEAFPAGSDSANDPNFVAWYNNVMLNKDSNTNTPLRHYNNLAKKPESSEDDSNDSNSDSNGTEDEDFNEFLRTNNLEYLDKASGKKFKPNANVTKMSKNKKDYQYKDDSDDSRNNDSCAKRGKNDNRGNRYGEDSDSDGPKYNDNKAEPKKKTLLKNFLSMF